MKKILILLVAAACVAAFSGCGNNSASTASDVTSSEETSASVPAEETVALTADEIAAANDAFTPTEADTESDSVRASEISCFFTSCYSSPADINFEEFLRYCPAGSDLGDSDVDEFKALLAVMDPTSDAALPSEYPVPIHRYSKADVSALLQKYAGITVDDLASTEGVIYLAEYDAYYNTTSDFAAGTFVCTGGDKTGSVIQLWSEDRLLTINETDDGSYLIASFTERKAG